MGPFDVMLEQRLQLLILDPQLVQDQVLEVEGGGVAGQQVDQLQRCRIPMVHILLWVGRGQW